MVRAGVVKALGRTLDEGADKKLLTQYNSEIVMAAGPSVLATKVDHFRAKRNRSRTGKGKDQVRVIIKMSPKNRECANGPREPDDQAQGGAEVRLGAEGRPGEGRRPRRLEPHAATLVEAAAAPSRALENFSNRANSFLYS